MEKLFSIVGSALLLATSAFAISLTKSPNKPLETKADDRYPSYSGLYERIEDVSEITVGSKVFLVTKRGYVFDGVGGNPAYAHGDPGGVTKVGIYDSVKDEDSYYEPYNYYSLDDTDKFILLNNKTAIELTVEAGNSSKPNLKNCFAFSAQFYIGSHPYFGHYLGENDEEQHDGKNEYESIAWFLDSFGIRSTKDEKSSFELTYDSNENKMLMRKVLYDDTTSYLRYNHSGARHHFCFGTAGDSNVNLYRKVDNEKLSRPMASAGILQDPEQLTYRLGEQLNCKKLIVTFRVTNPAGTSYKDYNLPYSCDSCSLFTDIPYITSKDEHNKSIVYVRIFNQILYPIEVNVTTNASGNEYTLSQSLPSDYRGTYLLRVTNGRVLKAAQSPEYSQNYLDYNDYSMVGSTIIAQDVDEYRPGTAVDEAAFQVVRTKIGDNYYYHALNSNGRYLCLGAQVDESDEKYIDSTTEATVSNAVTLTATSISIGEYRITDSYVKSKYITFTRQYDSVSLYKLSNSTDSVANEKTDFINYFVNKTALVCELDGEIGEYGDVADEYEKFTDEFWNDLKTEFNRMGPDAQAIFVNSSYTHNSEAINSVANVADRYDYILAKYNKEDFMLRKQASTYRDNFNVSELRNVSLFNAENNGAILVVVISLVAVSVTVGLFVFKKKH